MMLVLAYMAQVSYVGGAGPQDRWCRDPLWAVLAPQMTGAGSKTGPVPATVFCILCVLAAPAPTLE